MNDWQKFKRLEWTHQVVLSMCVLGAILSLFLIRTGVYEFALVGLVFAALGVFYWGIIADLNTIYRRQR